MTDRRRNIVLVTYDSLRVDHCGFMGYGRDTTPAMDRLADDGVVFENAIASGVPTIASMTAVMTGEHSLASPEIGFNEAQREQVTGRRTIAEVLSEAGYATGGLSPNPPASSYFGFDDGFDWFEDFLATEDAGPLERAWDRVFQRSIEGGSLATYVRLLRNVVGREEVLRPWEDYYDDLLAWRESVEEPYFLWVLLLEPHHPWFPPAAYREWSSRWDAYRSFRHYWEMLNSGWEPDFDDDVHQRLVDLYDDSIRYGDAFLERLRRDLAGDDPVVVVHADHGEEFGEHGRYGHQPYLTDELTHVPLVVGGNVERSGRVEAPVGLRDLAPTIADLAGVDHGFPGRSILGDDRTRRPWVTSKVFAGGDRRATIRTPTSKYLRADGREELRPVDTGARSVVGGDGVVAGRPAGTHEGDTDETHEEAAAEATGLAALLDAHVAAEREKRAIREGADQVFAEGDL